MHERVTSGYVDAHFNTSLLGRPLELVAGARYTYTDLSSSGTTRVLINLSRDETTPILTATFASAAAQPIARDSNYGRLLPSANVKWELGKDMVLRLSASKTLTRPLLEDLAPSFNYGVLTAGRRTANAGNVDLAPFTSVNLDASYEWYYKRGSGISLSYFHKDIDDYIISTTLPETVPSVVNPAFQIFDVTRPRNAESAKVEGVTAAWLHTFNFGLGFQAKLHQGYRQCVE